MIWIRRLLAIVLILAVILLFVTFVVLSRVNDTFGNPDFYIAQLRQADMYNFIYDEGLPAALEEMDFNTTLGEREVELNKFKPKVVSATRRVFPPQWIQARVEDVIGQVLPYLLGDTDRLSVTVPLKGRVSDLGEVLKDTVHDEEVFTELYDAAVTYAVDEGMAGLEDAPFDIGLTRQEMRSAIETIVSQAWLQAQMDGAVDQVVPYLVGDAERFEVRIELKSRVHAVADVAMDLLSKPEAYDYLFDEMVIPTITGEIGGSIELPYEIVVTQDEVINAFKEILPRPWFNERMEEIVGEAVSYVDGTSDTFEIVVPLADRKAAALTVLDDLAERKIQGVLDALPDCSVQDALRLVQNPPPFGQLPGCKPLGLSYEQIKGILGIDFGAAINTMVGIPIPDQLRFTKGDLLQMLGEENEEVLEEARKYVSQGWTYTDADLREDLSEEEEKRLDDARGWIRDGFTFTEEDLRDAFEEFGGMDTGYGTYSIDDVRGSLGRGRRWSSLAGWLIIAVLAALVGLLGGRNWYSRLAWAAFPLLVASLLLYLAFGPGYNASARMELESALRDQMVISEDVPRVFVEKGITVALNVVDTFVGGIASQALVVLVITGLITVGGVVLQIVRPRQRGPEPLQ